MKNWALLIECYCATELATQYLTTELHFFFSVWYALVVEGKVTKLIKK